MKDCKLEIFEYDLDYLCYVDARGFKYNNEDIWYWGEDKRLKTPELMAEYHRMAREFDIVKYGLEHDPYLGQGLDADDIGERLDALFRFATLSHEEFDED